MPNIISRFHMIRFYFFVWHSDLFRISTRLPRLRAARGGRYSNFEFKLAPHLDNPIYLIIPDMPAVSL